MNASELKAITKRMGRPDFPWDLAVDVLATCEHVEPDALLEEGLTMGEAVTCLLLLTGAPTYALKAQWYFQQYELTGWDVSKAVGDGAFAHPVTGENVEDFESKIFVVYERDRLVKE